VRVVFPKYHKQYKLMVKVINEWLANNGALPLEVRIGGGNTVHFTLDRLAVMDWSEGPEIVAVLYADRVAPNGQVQHLTLSQAQINSLWRQMGYTARTFQPGFPEYAGAE
jgi:hypothetical protein